MNLTIFEQIAKSIHLEAVSEFGANIAFEATDITTFLICSHLPTDKYSDYKVIALYNDTYETSGGFKDQLHASFKVIYSLSHFIDDVQKEDFVYGTNLLKFNNFILQDFVRKLIINSNDDPFRAGLLDTPRRYVKALQELADGESHLTEYTTFDIDDEHSDTIKHILNTPVVLKDIKFHSLCEHHLLPYWGTVDIAYLPNDKIIGLSKIPRIVKKHSRSFSTQEFLTKTIANELSKAVGNVSTYCKITARHTCMEMRGIESNSTTVTTAFESGIELNNFDYNHVLQLLSNSLSR